MGYRLNSQRLELSLYGQQGFEDYREKNKYTETF